MSSPAGFTLPPSVAPEELTADAVPVVTVGATAATDARSRTAWPFRPPAVVTDAVVAVVVVPVGAEPPVDDVAPVAAPPVEDPPVEGVVDVLPVDEEPVCEAPFVEAPVVDPPVDVAPPPNDEPVEEEEPVADDPVEDAPVGDDPVDDEPVDDAPVAPELEEAELVAGKPSRASRLSCALAVTRVVLSEVSCCSSVISVCRACWMLTWSAARCAAVSPFCALARVLFACARFASAD